MPAGIPGGVIVNPGGAYNGQPVQTAFLDLNRRVAAGDPQATTDLQNLAALPQFHGFGWQGLVAMLGIIGAGAAAAALSGAASGAAASTPSLSAIQAGAVPTIPLGATASGTAATAGLASPALAGLGGGTAASTGGILGALGGTKGAINAGIAGLGGALENTKGARTSTTTPTYPAEYKTLQDLLRARAEDNLRSRFDISGLQASGLNNINQVFKGLNQSAANNLTTRGLATSPVAATVGTNLDLARGGQMVDYLNNLPLLQQQLETQNINNALGILGSVRGTTGVGAGSALGGGFTSAAEMLAYLNGRGALGARPGSNVFGSGSLGGGVFS